MISFKNDKVSSSLKHKCDYYILEALKEQHWGGGDCVSQTTGVSYPKTYVRFVYVINDPETGCHKLALRLRVSFTYCCDSKCVHNKHIKETEMPVSGWKITNSFKGSVCTTVLPILELS
jgi:hypothetical protein